MGSSGDGESTKWGVQEMGVHEMGTVADRDFRSYRNISCIMRIFFFNFAAQTRGAHYKLVLTKSVFLPSVFDVF